MTQKMIFESYLFGFIRELADNDNNYTCKKVLINFPTSTPVTNHQITKIQYSQNTRNLSLININIVFMKIAVQ